jgi:DeoR/GlpR family transcriptional regulator of sugar metabolism
MFAEERHAEILKIIEKEGRISIGDIQEKFEVSVDSARRDLRILEEKGLLKRTHGGAIPLPQISSGPGRYTDVKKYADPNNTDVFPNYDAIAKKTAEFIKENDIIYLTSGSLGFIMLRHLPQNFPYTLVLNSVALADELKFWDNLTVYITGGKMRMHSRANMVDTLAANFVKNMRFDLNLMTGGGYEAKFGFSNGTDETANFQRTVIEQSRKNILMMPNQKIGFTAFIKVCEADKFDILVTDQDAVEDELAKIEELGVKIMIAEAADR